MKIKHARVIAAVAAVSAAVVASGAIVDAHERPSAAFTTDIGGTGSVTAAAERYLSGLERQHKFSGAVLLAQDGRLIVRTAYGWANLQRHIPNRWNTRFRIGSLTKAFTAMSVLRLQDEGRLNVDDPICRYVGRCPQAWVAVTLRQLLTQSSGIPDYVAQPAYARISRTRHTPAQLLDLVRSLPLKFTPGTRWSYSNTGYVLLGMAIERVSGQSYARFLRREVLAPLGLNATSYDVNHPPLQTHATGYSAWTTRAPYIDMSTPFAAGALSSSIDDLDRWDEALLNDRPQLVHPETLQQMFKPWVPIDAAHPAFGDYGYGWFIDPRHDEYDHDGEINGFVSFNAIFPRERAVVIVLSNQQATDVRTIADHVGALIGLHGF